jgi:serine phosphatase RsbU (regulator of sigma subunit)
VSARYVASGETSLAEDAEFVAAELLANAHQHGAPPIVVRLTGGAGSVRLEVSDASPSWPVVVSAGAGNMTGRGLALVDAVSTSWGVLREPDGGKTIWCELSHRHGGERVALAEIEEVFATDITAAGEPRYTVVLGDVPTAMLVEAKAHVDNLVREFSLAAAEPSADPQPTHLAALIRDVVHGFTEAREAIKRQALVAARRGAPRTSLTLHLPLSAADAGERYLAALDEIDDYARAARLLTMETPADHRLFRRWYVEAVVAQLRRLARGEPAGQVQPFVDRMLGEIRLLAAAQRAGDRAARLQRVTAALARARTPEDVASAVVAEAVRALGASGGGLLLPAPDGIHLAVSGAVGYGATLMRQLGDEPLDAELPAATALRSGQPIWLESRQERDAQFPELHGFEPDTTALCAVPLVIGARTIGALRFSFDTVKLFDEAERRFVTALAAQAAQTLQRTRTYAAERQAALDLQRALLPQAAVHIPGWDFAAYYGPAGGQEVGGDFYDVVSLPDGRVAAVIGDVMGRGTYAAAAMAEVRSAIRAYATDDPDPVAVFRRIDTYFEVSGLAQLVTVLYFLLDHERDVIRVANAGHLPPLLLADGTARVVELGGGLPFGVGLGDRTASTIRLSPGEAVVAFTDGLVERRTEDIDVGVQRLIESVERVAWQTPAGLVNSVVAAAARGSQDDDVTVLLLRRAPAC